MKFFRVLFLIILILFSLDVFDLFQTKIQIFKTFIIYSTFIMPVVLLILEIKIGKKDRVTALRILVPVLIISGLIYLNPLKVFFEQGVWKTQVVELVNKNSSNHKVEIQMKNIGFRGYLKRHSEVYYLTDYFYIILAEKYDDRNFLGYDWESVSLNKNELELIYP